jgi:putative transposase
MKRGQQKRIPAPGQQQTHHVFAAYDWHADTVVWTTSANKNSDAFIAFLEALLVTHYPTGRCVLVLDNASYHTSAASLAALSLFEHRVLVFWLPKYCSLELNAIERFWRHLKDLVCVDTLFPSLAQLVDAVDAQLSCQNNLDYPQRFAFLKQ